VSCEIGATQPDRLLYAVRVAKSPELVNVLLNPGAEEASAFVS